MYIVFYHNDKREEVWIINDLKDMDKIISEAWS